METTVLFVMSILHNEPLLFLSLQDFAKTWNFASLYFADFPNIVLTL